MDSPAPADSADQRREARIDRLYQAEKYERLRHDAAFFSDIWMPDDTRFANFADLFGSGGKWDDGDGQAPLEGAEPIAAKLRSLPGLFGLKLGLHLVGLPRMEATADSGSARWPMVCFVTSVGGVSGFVAGQYLETYGLRDGRSRIAHSVVEPAVMPTLTDD